MRSLMKSGQIKPNGKPNTYDISYGPLEKGIAAIIISLSVSAVTGNILMFRELGIVSSQLSDARVQLNEYHNQLVSYEAVVNRDFLTKAEFERFLNAEATRENRVRQFIQRPPLTSSTQ